GGQDEDDDDWDHRPCQLHWVAAVDLGRLAAVVVGTPTVADQAVDHQATDDHEDDAGDRQHEERQGLDRVRRSAGGGEDARAVHDVAVAFSLHGVNGGGAATRVRSPGDLG